MYFEVSPRQSGKTTRLIKDLFSNLLIDINFLNKYVIISPSFPMKEYFKNKISEFLDRSFLKDYSNKINRNMIFISSNDGLNKNIIPIEIMMQSNQCKIYIDDIFECYYIKDILCSWLSNDDLSKNIYCSGTPNDNKLFYQDLIKLNNGNVFKLIKDI